MPAVDTIASLTAFEGRGPGTDAERRAAAWLRAELGAGNRSARLEPFWGRPNWALAHAWHAVLALAGGLLSVSHPTVGVAMVAVAILCLLVDEATGISPGRRLTRERASQNVVGASGKPESGQRVRLIVVANYDAGRMGLVYRTGPRGVAARLHRATSGRAPGWLAWLVLILGWLLVIAVARLRGAHGTVVGILQLPPTVALVLVIALLLEQGTSPFGPAADNASGVAVALALARALEFSAPRALRVKVLLAGAGEGGAIGVRRFLRAHRGELNARNAIVLAVAPCGAGSPRWWYSDGSLIPLAYHPRLRAACAGLAQSEPQLGLGPHRGRGATQALRARIAGLPAIAIGCLDERGIPTRSHQPGDTAAAIDRAAVDATLGLALMLIDAIDAELTARGATSAGGSA
jgi:hypothetical protein